MEYRRLGKQGIQVSEVGLGSWLTYGNAVEGDETKRCLTRAYELGVNFFDTANAYAGGESERAVGAALAGFSRESLVIATKVYFGMGPGPNERGLSRKHVYEQCHASLRRLGVDYIDLYQCHRYDDNTPMEETLSVLDNLTRQGKILYYGVSEWSARQIEEASKICSDNGFIGLASNQPQYSLMARGIELETLPTCERLGVGQVVFSPLAQGVLTGKYLPGLPPPPDSRAADPKQNMFLKNGELDAWVQNRVKIDDTVLSKVQTLKSVAMEHDMTLAQMALAWCLRKPIISSVIIGASRPQQIDDNVKASGIKLSNELINIIEATLA